MPGRYTKSPSATAVATSLSNNTSAIAALTSEISGLRATMHKVAGMQSSVETRLHIVEEKVKGPR